MYLRYRGMGTRYAMVCQNWYRTRDSITAGISVPVKNPRTTLISKTACTELFGSSKYIIPCKQNNFYCWDTWVIYGMSPRHAKWHVNSSKMYGAYLVHTQMLSLSWASSADAPCCVIGFCLLWSQDLEIYAWAQQDSVGSPIHSVIGGPLHAWASQGSKHFSQALVTRGVRTAGGGACRKKLLEMHTFCGPP